MLAKSEIIPKQENITVLFGYYKKDLQLLRLRSLLFNLIEETNFDLFLCKQSQVTFQVDNFQYPLSQISSTITIICKLERKLK